MLNSKYAVRRELGVTRAPVRGQRSTALCSAGRDHRFVLLLRFARKQDPQGVHAAPIRPATFVRFIAEVGDPLLDESDDLPRCIWVARIEIGKNSLAIRERVRSLWGPTEDWIRPS